MKKVLLSFALILWALTAVGANKRDSLLIIKADWKVTTTPEGLTHKQAHIKGLFNSVQSINLIEIPRSAKMKVGIAGDEGMKRTSQQATEKGALAAINGTYYNMVTGNSVCFYKINDQVLDTTTNGEFKSRVNGAIREVKGNIEIIDWNKEIEANYKKNKGTVLASGPIMVDNGRISDWSKCDKKFIETRHPRSAIFTKKNGTIVFLTVDGRSEGNAAGMSIPELAYLAKILGAEDAINLDGGGSTTLWLKGAPENGVLNYPSDNKRFDHKGERSVSNIFYVK
ncbi:MAG: phosphodiester glycosidase family protein [Rikenellaceae bacterium]|nr:phosphodiester glycosidase family protein [Rikenellaceae bacterium]